MLENPPEDTDSGPSLAAMERAGKLQCLITSNIYAKAQRAGCKNVVNLHGTIYENKCPHCGREYTMEQVRDAKKILLCDKCDIPIRPQVSLFGEMEKFMDSFPEFEDRDLVLDFYFALRDLLNTYDRVDENYRIYTEFLSDGRFMLRLFNMNPAKNLKECLDKGNSTVFFSATLLSLIHI